MHDRGDLQSRQDSKKIIFFLVDGYPTFRPDVKILFGHSLCGRGIQSDLVTTCAHPPSTVDKWPAGEVFLALKRTRFDSFIAFVRNDIFGLRRVYHQRYDAVQVRDKPIFAFAALIAARLANKPFFYWMSFPYPESQLAVAKAGMRKLGFVRYLSLVIRGHIGAWILYNLVIPRSNHVFVQSKKMLADVILKSGRKLGITAVPMGFDPQDFAPTIARRSDEFEVVKLVYLGSCDKVRKVDFLLEVLRFVIDSGYQCEMIIIGDATEQHDRLWLRDKVAELGLELFVEITGWIDQAEARDRMRSADIGLALMAPHPILDSTSPTKLVEYMASGLPVVANEHLDQREMIIGSGGGVVTPFEVQAYARGVISLILDEKLRVQMGTLGREYISRTRNYDAISIDVEIEYRSALSVK